MAILMPPIQLIAMSKAREIARKWRSEEGSPLDVFASNGSMPPGIMIELDRTFHRPLTSHERADLEALGTYLAASLWQSRRRLIDANQR